LTNSEYIPAIHDFMRAGNQLIPISAYSYTELAEIYNQARVDYIVPMPMNAKRMQEYVEAYDISLEGSVVALTDEGLPCGIGMLGMREGRGWITRLGVIPERRKNRAGQAIMEHLIQSAKDQQARLIQLEVIVGNEPASNLFKKLGFAPTRDLLVIRRPPSLPAPNMTYDSLAPITLPESEIPALLTSRQDNASWIEETKSLLNVDNLRGLKLVSDTGEWGWIIFQRSPFQLTHFVLSYNDDWLAKALLYHVHKEYPKLDTKIENVAIQDRIWDVYQQMGYIEVFRRTEMFLYLK
jgi:ribosomal protein S18 acetylase RimI-like enzyme